MGEQGFDAVIKTGKKPKFRKNDFDHVGNSRRSSNHCEAE